MGYSQCCDVWCEASGFFKALTSEVILGLLFFFLRLCYLSVSFKEMNNKLFLEHTGLVSGNPVLKHFNWVKIFLRSWGGTRTLVATWERSCNSLQAWMFRDSLNQPFASNRNSALYILTVSVWFCLLVSYVAWPDAVVCWRPGAS